MAHPQPQQSSKARASRFRFGQWTAVLFRWNVPWAGGERSRQRPRKNSGVPRDPRGVGKRQRRRIATQGTTGRIYSLGAHAAPLAVAVSRVVFVLFVSLSNVSRACVRWQGGTGRALCAPNAVACAAVAADADAGAAASAAAADAAVAVAQLLDEDGAAVAAAAAADPATPRCQIVRNAPAP